MTRYKVRIPRSFKYIVLTTVFDGVHPYMPSIPHAKAPKLPKAKTPKILKNLK